MIPIALGPARRPDGGLRSGRRRSADDGLRRVATRRPVRRRAADRRRSRSRPRRCAPPGRRRRPPSCGGVSAAGACCRSPPAEPACAGDLHRRLQRLLEPLPEVVGRQRRGVAGSQRRHARHAAVRRRRAVHPRRRQAPAPPPTTTAAHDEPPAAEPRRPRPPRRRPRRRRRHPTPAPAPRPPRPRPPRRRSTAHPPREPRRASRRIIREVWPDELEERAARDRQARERPAARALQQLVLLRRVRHLLRHGQRASWPTSASRRPSNSRRPHEHRRPPTTLYTALRLGPLGADRPRLTDRTVRVPFGRPPLDSPVAPTALVAQWIEHLTTDQKVGGSTPSERAE